MSDKKMTDKQQKFADEYLIDCNATRAYKTIYTHVKKDDVARANSSRLLKLDSIKKYIDAELLKIHSAKIANVEEIMIYLSAVLRGESISEVVVIEGEFARTMKKRPSEAERLRAAELLGKRYAMFTDKMKVESEPVIILNDLKE